ncbi:pentapeptide repeat-containing protein [Streptosporangium canum]|uniref:pentapeptide repeat-containing protein n=1 Tax=Streptosporangium canum TaxID=324952 RepID=UPI0036CBCBC3
MPAPRERADLPYANHLEAFSGRLTSQGDYDTVVFEGEEFEEAEASNARFIECVFSSMTFTGGHYPRARFSDVWVHTVRWVGSELTETTWLDAEVIDSALAGVAMFGSQMRRVTFYNCKFDGVNARTVTLQDVAFVDCMLQEVDLAGATLTNVTFPGSVLERVRFDKAQMSKVDLRGAAALGITDGYDALKGATISSAQLLELAPMFAQILGVTVKDD